MAKKKNDLGGGCLVLFGLPFLAAGLFVLFMGIKPVYMASKAEAWPKLEARLNHVELEINRDSDGGTTYEVIARYTYTYQNREYESDQVNFSSGADNIGSYQKDKFKHLQRAKKRKLPVSCYVNPESPDQAVLDREVRTESLLFMIPFGSIFALVGAGLVFGPLFMGRRSKKEKLMETQEPNKPWLWNKKWQDGVIDSSTNSSFLGSLALAIGLNLFLTPFWVGLLSDNRAPFFAFAIVGLFQVFGLWEIGAFFYQLMRRFKYGKTTFCMETFPAVIGGSCRGLIKVPTEVKASDGFELKIENIHQYTSGSGKNSTTHRKVLWQQQKKIKARRHSESVIRTELEVDFELPSGGRISESDGDTKYWQLTATSETPGVDFKAEFRLPAYITEQSEDKPVEEVDYEELPVQQGFLQKELLKHKITLKETSDSLHLIVPARRRWSAVFISFLFLAGFSGGLAYAISEKEYVASAFVGIGTLISAFCFYAYTFIRRETEVEKGLISVRECHPFGGQTLHATVEEVSFNIGWTSSTNDKPSAWKLEAKRGKDKSLAIITGFKNQLLLKQLRKKIEEILEA